MIKYGNVWQNTQTYDKSHPLYDKKIVITGFRDKNLQKQIEKIGGKMTSSVSKKTSFIVVGEKPGSKKEKAQKLDVPIIESASFLSWYNGGQAPEIIRTVDSE